MLCAGFEYKIKIRLAQKARRSLVLSYTRLVLGERSPLGRAAALLARCPPPTTSNLDLLCGADRHPSSPFALSGSSVGQRGIFAQTTQLLVPATQTISVS